VVTYPEEFARSYDQWAAGETADIDFYVSLALEAAGPVVELAVGSGRVAVPIAAATGRAVIGIDSSATMLEAARRRAADAGVELVLQLGDMADLHLDQPAALIICPFRSLLHVPTWARRRRVFERVATALVPGGRFAWNAFAFDHRYAASADGVRSAELVPHTDHFWVGDNRVDIVSDNGATISLWWATKNEWFGLVDVANLEVEALYGDFDRTPFDEGSNEYVFVARKPLI
jgi:ubiquinone/menaquinone biosynthesis C-methylase UbiE